MKGPRGYPIEPVATWLESYLRQRVDSRKVGSGEAQEDDGDLREKYLRSQIREREAAAELKEIQIKIQHGELVPREKIVQRDLERVAAVKKGLLALPRRLAQELHGLAPREIEAVLRDRMRELCDAFAGA